MPSSVIRRFVYDQMEGNLWVEFTTGRRYVYSGVPHEVADAFRGAFAKGVYFSKGSATAFRTVKSRTSKRKPNLKRRERSSGHVSDAFQHDFQESLDGTGLGGRNHLVRL